MMNNMIRIFLAIILPFMLFVGPVRTASGQAANTQIINSYNDLAAIVSEPIFDESSVKKARDAYTDGVVMSLKEYQRQRLNGLGHLDASIQDAREKISETLWKCNNSYQEIRRLDSNTPDYEGLAKETIAALPALLKNQKDRNTNDTQAITTLSTKAFWEVGSAIANLHNLSVERDKYRKYYGSSRSTTDEAMIGLLQRRYTTSEYRSSDKAITIPFVNPSLANTYINDIIAIRNDSGKDLTACTVRVKLDGINATSGDSETDKHFHYVSYWPAGEYRYVWYPSRALRGIATNQSVDVIHKVEVIFVCDQFFTIANFDFRDKRYDDYLEKWANEHLKPAYFTGRWYTNKETYFDPAGFEVAYKGDIAQFTVQRVTVEAIQGNRSVSIYDASSQWSFSKKKWICHRDFNTINPSKINVIITFPGSSYKHVIYWER